MNLKILLVDDHTLFRKGLKALLLHYHPGWEIREAENGVKAILEVSASRPDIVLMDYDMPKLDGLKAAGQIIRDNPGIRVIILSMHTEAEIIRRMSDFGVMGMVEKNAGDDELLQAIEQVKNGLRHFSLPIEEPLRSTASKKRKPGSQSVSGLLALSVREIEVFRGLVQGQHPAVIAETLSISPRTLDSHKTSIFRKCSVHSVPELIRFAYQNRAI
jgi:DNA-binding NarL/FixJ family response regulator